MSLKSIIRAMPLAALVAGAPAMAAEQTWNFDETSLACSDSTVGTSCSGSSTDVYGNSISLIEDGITLTVSGWSDTDGPTSAPPEGLETAELIYYADALGIKNQDEDGDTPNHSIDSYDPINDPDWGNDFDAALLEFDSSVILDEIEVQWAYEDWFDPDKIDDVADISVLAYAGDPADFTGFTSDDTWENIVSSGGWVLVGNYMNVDDYAYQAVNDAEISSELWLVSAYNPVFDGSSYTSGNDGFKLAGAKTTSGGITQDPPGMPTPGTAALLLLGLLVLRRRQGSPTILA